MMEGVGHAESDPPTVASSRSRMEIRLVGGPHADGEVPLDELAGIAQRAQELVSRLARELSGRSGAGRTPDELRDLGRLLLVGLRGGSTTLEIAGPELQPELDLSADVPGDAGTQALERFGLVLEALTGPDPTLLPGLDPPAARSASDLVGVLAPYPEVDVVLDVQGRRRLLQLRPGVITNALRGSEPPTESTEAAAAPRAVAGVAVRPQPTHRTVPGRGRPGCDHRPQRAASSSS